MELTPDVSSERLIDLAGVRAGLDGHPHAVAILDALSGAFVYQNGESRRLASEHGRVGGKIGSLEELRSLDFAGKPFTEQEEPSRRLLGRGEAFEATPFLLLCPDASRLRLEMKGRPIFDEGGAVVGAILTYWEVVESSEFGRPLRFDEESEVREQRQRLLVLLDEAVRDLETPEEIVGVTTHLVGRHLDVAQCHYGTVDEEADLVRIFKGYVGQGEPKEGTFRLAGFGEVLERQRAGFTDAVDDTRTDPRTRDAYRETYGPMRMRAFIGVPLVKEGKEVAFFTVNEAEPRHWTQEEIRLVEAVAARTWMAVEHLEALRQLREREAQFRALVEGMPNFVWSADVDGRSKYRGPQWAAYTGLDPTYANRLSAYNLLHPEDRARVQEEWDTAVARGVPFETEYRLRSAEGEYRYFRAQANPIHDGSGAVAQWIGTTTDVHEARAMRIALEARSHQLARAYDETFDRLARAAALRDDDTADHTKRVALLSCRIATRLGIERHSAEELGRAAELHDLGKIGIPDAILHKPGRLSEDERRLMETHTTLGASLLDGGESSLLRQATAVALSHHERWDGGGYPHGLAGEAIPLDGRIVAVADAYDAMTNDRPYRHALPGDEALEILMAGRGTQWDAAIVDAFLALKPSS